VHDSPWHDLVAALVNPPSPSDGTVADAAARPDLDRERRTAKPEVIYAPGKTPEQILELTRTFLDRRGRAIVSRIDPVLATDIAAHFPDHAVRHAPRAQMLVVRAPGYTVPVGGNVAIITAGTSDLPVAEQAQVIAEEMGCQVELAADVGVAGIHRLFGPLRRILESEVDVIVVAAGMDGALPSVVSGLVDRPVIGVPTSTGYGVGGQGLAALLSMLQTCAPGLTVVNVDNGIGAGITAALIANRAAQARRT
jgi:NCAIR mutase (PurE)-related protein